MAQFEDAIIQAIADRFFMSEPISTTPDGFIQYGAAPALRVAYAIYEAKKDEIFEAVMANLDVDDLATKIAVKVSEDLTQSPGWQSSWNGTSRDELRKQVREAVIDKIAAGQVAELRALAEGPNDSA